MIKNKSIETLKAKSNEATDNEAKQTLYEGLINHPDAKLEDYLKFAIFLRDVDLSKSLTILDEAQNKFGESSWIEDNRARAFISLNRLEMAAESWEKAIILANENEKTFFITEIERPYQTINNKITQEISKEKSDKNWDNIVTILEAYLLKQPSNLFVYLELAIAYRNKKDYESALDILKLSEKNNLKNSWIYDNYARIFFHLGQYKKSIRACLIALKNARDDYERNVFIEILETLKEHLATEYQNGKHLSIFPIDVVFLLAQLFDEKIEPNDIPIDVNDVIASDQYEIAFQKNNKNVSGTKKEQSMIPNSEKHVFGIAGNTLWLLNKTPSSKAERSLTIIHEPELFQNQREEDKKSYNLNFKGFHKKQDISADFQVKNDSLQTLALEYFNDCHSFLASTLAGHNLLANGNFGDEDEASLANWIIDAEQPATGGIDLSEEWHLTNGHTAFLLTTVGAKKPSLKAKQKILIISNGNIEYRFAGFFASYLADGMVTLDFYNLDNKKIGEHLIHVAQRSKYSGGTDLKNYRDVESTFVPTVGTAYILLNITLSEQTELSESEACLFMSQLFLGINTKESKQYIPFSLGAYELLSRALQGNWNSFGKVELPVLQKTTELTIDYNNNLYQINLIYELAAIHLIEAVQQQKLHTKNLWLASHRISEDSLPIDLTLEKIHRLNPFEHFDDIYQALSASIDASPVSKLRIDEDDKINASFYLQFAINYEGAKQTEQAIELYRLSLLFANTAKAHEHLANISLEMGKIFQAIAHYKTALDLNSQSYWVYLNLARAQELSGQYKEAVTTICAGIKAYPGSTLLMAHIDGYIRTYWDAKDQELECIAVSQNREKLIIEYKNTTTFICNTYAQIFKRNSTVPFMGRLNIKRVLIIGLTFEAAPQCFRYRIEQKLEQLEFAGYDAESVPWHHHESALNLINLYDLIIFYRVPALPGVLKLVEYAKSLGKITFYELDDLLFLPVSVPPLETYGGQLSLSIYTSVTKDIGSHHAIATQCDYAIASTLPLIEKLAPLTQTQIGYLHRNGLDKYNQQRHTIPVKKSHINLFYGSGTLAHNTDFIIEALPAISKILKEHKEVKLIIAGYLTLPDIFLSEFDDRIVQVPFIKDIEIYWEYLSAADINLAVLHDDVLTACKSELKWFEAAVFSIPSVVSRTKNYLDVIKQGEDGFVVNGEHEWFKALKQLIENPDLRQSIGRKAYERVKAEYSVAALAKNIDQIITSAVLHDFDNRNKTNSMQNMGIAISSHKKKKIAVVNLLFPPKALGGATRIMADEVSLLANRYGNDYEIVVFTADFERSPKYKLDVYPFNGCRVYTVSCDLNIKTNWHPQDEEMANVFDEFLMFEQPDLIHFHCIQVLTGSIVEVTQKRQIPHFITVHDGWWISDHQFLIDQFDKVYLNGHPDPFEKINLPEGITLEQSIKRRSYLKGLLTGSNGVFAVSDTFNKLYEKNGIANVVTNKNGISDTVSWQPKNTEYTEKVVCAHIGGMSAYKGFDIFKQAVLDLNAPNIEILIVDHFKDENYLNVTSWGVTPVTIIGLVNQSHIDTLYKRIDVLFAPSICPESFGLVSREATACGCWVVASDIGGIGDDISPTNGFKISPTKENLLMVLNEINQAPEKYKALSAASHIRYSSEQVEELVAIFNAI